MKFFSLVLVLICFQAQAGVPVSITKFVDKSGSSSCRDNWGWWSEHLGDGFREMLAAEVLKTSGLELYERETIQDIYEDEHKLVNSSDDKSLKKGGFKKAKYTFVGAVTEFEFCASRNGGSVGIGKVASLFGVSMPDVDVGYVKARAKLAVDIRVIDTYSGRVLKSVRGEAETNDSSFAIDTYYGDFSSQENSPMGKAAREAIAKAAVEAIKVIR